MKKLFLLIPFCVLLSGCSAIANTPPEIQAAFSAKASVTIGEQELTCTVTRIPQGAETISLVTPEALKGITYKLLDGKCTIAYDELNFQTDTLFLPDNTFVSCWIDLWKCIDSAVYETTENQSVRFVGSCNNGKFTIYTDTNGYAEKILVPALDMNIELNETKPLKL